MKLGAILFSWFIFITLGYSQPSSIIMSSIGSQEVYEGARISVFFSTLKHFESIEFESPDIPDFGTLINDGAGNGRFVFDPTESDIGTYTITLETTSGDLYANTTFDLEVMAIPDDATVYYVDPINGSSDNPGTSIAPFLTMADVLTNHLAQISGNTFFYLRNGFHGSPVFQGAYDSPVYVLAERNHSPAVKKLNFFLTTNWYVSGLDISPATNNQVDNTTLVNVSAGSKKIVLTNCKIYSIEDASVWATNEAWYDGCGNGIISSGKACLFTNNYLKNTWFSVELRKEDCEFSYNIIDWFGADAIRALDDNQRILYNQIKNATVFDYAHPTRPQHDDGIQSWTFNNPVRNIKIIGNQIVDISDPNLPLPTQIMQGIVDFDGFAEDWIIENNLVITHHSHGIALYGAKNCKITNNTVIRNPLNYYSPTSFPWIRINPRKEDVGGDLSTGNLVRNNIMATYQDENKEPGTQDHNIIGNNYGSLFEDYNGWNFHLSGNSPAKNAGTLEDAPTIDLYQKQRVVGNIDAGCFEQGAVIIDREKPTPPSNITTVEVSATSMTLEWMASQDNIGVAYYEVEIDGRVLYSDEPTIFITGVNPGTEYEINIRAIDYFDNHSTETVHTVTTENLEMLAIYFVAADRHDQLIKSNNKLMWAGMPLHRIGGYFGTQDASVVLPFQMPCLGNDRQIVSADLTVSLDNIINAPIGNIDVYGLGFDPISCVSADSHWQGAYGSDPDGTPIAEAYITPQSSIGYISLGENEKVALGLYLQAHLDNNDACADFTFLRLNIGLDQAKDNAYYSIHSAERLNSFQVPLLSILTSGSNAVIPVEIENGISVAPNPLQGDVLTLQIKGFETEPAQIVIHNAKGQEVFRKNYDPTINEYKLDLNTNLESGMYFLTILGQQKYARTKFVKI